ncbi:unnamed protein product [Spirodela intermedia]|uniref:Uncharacterized protein n=1 Tax=Spirodela intermedia TaxID=51605 RepID=A0A7I8LE66_SPIIN|nr:unnamed protein product [Spirodela intermedia]
MIQAHYSNMAMAILDHQVVNKCGCNHAHHNTFYLI